MAVGLWQRGGVLVYLAWQLDPTGLASVMAQNGFGWVAVQTHDGVTPVRKGPRGADYEEWLRPFRDFGIRVGGWGVLRTNAVEEAELAVARQRELGLGFYIADAELEHKYTAADGTHCAECFEQGRKFVTRFRQLAPTMKAALSSYPRFDRADLHWAAWYAAKFRALPQAYLNEFGDYASPRNAVNGAVDVKQPWNEMRDLRGNIIPGWPRSWVHPTIGLYDTPGQPHITAEEWVALLEESDVPPGFSLYLGEFMLSRWDEWQVFGEAIRTKGIAKT